MKDKIDAAQAGIDAVVTETYGVTRGGLRAKLARATRRMPRGSAKAAAEDLDYLDAARKRTAHPKRRGQVDRERVERMAAEHGKRHAKVDLARDRARDRINWLGVLVINLMLFAVIYWALLRWIGLI
ncbi:MAG: hypothetical protein AAF631_09250 [Pseudomonadota bacterium]